MFLCMREIATFFLSVKLTYHLLRGTDRTNVPQLNNKFYGNRMGNASKQMMYPLHQRMDAHRNTHPEDGEIEDR
jgi:hypothetical protein